MLPNTAIQLPGAGVQPLGGGPVLQKPKIPGIADPQNDMAAFGERTAGPANFEPFGGGANAPDSGLPSPSLPMQKPTGSAMPTSASPAKPQSGGQLPDPASLFSMPDAPRQQQVKPIDVSAAGFNASAAGVRPQGDLNANFLQGFDRFSDAIMAEQNRYLNPMLDAREAQFRQRMVNQGIVEGTEAFDRAFANFSRERNDAMSSARNQALIQALGAQNQAFGQDFSGRQLDANVSIANAQMSTQAAMAQAQATMQARMQEQALMEQGRQFDANFGLNRAQLGSNVGMNLLNFGFQNQRADMQDLMSLLGYGQSVDQYNNALLGQDQQRAGALFGLIPGLTPTQLDVTGPMNSYLQAQSAARNAQASSRNGVFGALGQIGAAGVPFMFSDARLKTDIQRVGTLDNGLPIYRYRYKAGGPMQIGVMAQDVQQVRPGAVAEIDGFLAVNYAEATA